VLCCCIMKCIWYSKVSVWFLALIVISMMHECYIKLFYFYISWSAWRTLLISSILMGWGKGLVLQWSVGLEQCHSIKVTPFLWQFAWMRRTRIFNWFLNKTCTWKSLLCLLSMLLWWMFSSKPADACFAFLWERGSDV